MIADIIRAEAAHIPAIMEQIRQVDIYELVDPAGTMAANLQTSQMAWSGTIDGQPVCMFGVIDGVAWFVGTESIGRHKILFLRRCRECVDAMHSRFPRLIAYAKDDNLTSRKWLEWLGFRAIKTEKGFVAMEKVLTDIIRATHEHIELLTQAADGILADLPNYAGVIQDAEHTRKMLTTFMGLDDLGCFFKAVDGQVVGLFMGMVHPQWFTPTLEMSELMFWVRADYRKSNLAVELVKAMEAWAIAKGAKKLLIAVTSGYETENIAMFYKWLGYEKFGLITCKGV